MRRRARPTGPRTTLCWLQVGAVTTPLDTTSDKLAHLRSWQSDLTWRLMFDCSPVAQMPHRPLAAITSVNQRFVEFVLVLPGRKIEQAERVAERLMQCVSRTASTMRT